MKARVIAVTVGLLPVVTGGLMLVLATQVTPHTVQRSIYFDQPKHPVTEEMRAKVSEQTDKTAPRIEVKDAAGKPVVIGGMHSSKPQFVYFVQDGCPCSVDAEPLFQKLYEHFEHRVEFVAVTDGDVAKARKWANQMLMPYPIVADPKLEIVRRYRAENSVYSALIDSKGSIVKMWPGYSQGILKEMNESMAKLLGDLSSLVE